MLWLSASPPPGGPTPLPTGYPRNPEGRRSATLMSLMAVIKSSRASRSKRRSKRYYLLQKHKNKEHAIKTNIVNAKLVLRTAVDFTHPSKCRSFESDTGWQNASIFGQKDTLFAGAYNIDTFDEFSL